MAFNESQLAAIRHGGGPMLVLAGPGSGKTTVITNRVKNLIEEQGEDPASILVITFTRAAAREMKERFLRLCGGAAGGVTFGTFHSVFFTVLRLAYHYDAASILREGEGLRILTGLLKKTGSEREDLAEFSSLILQEISSVKGERKDLLSYHAKACPDDLFRTLYRGYEETLLRDHRIDFDDMLTLCYDLFRDRPDVLAHWQQKYRSILVDEFQDINRIQYEIVRMMAAPEDNLFIVGDDDQAIYRFRGSNPGIMLGFANDYPGAKKVLLGRNYRSVKPVVEAASRLIAHNKTRFFKEFVCVRGAGHPVMTEAYEDPEKEAAGIVRAILDYRKMGFAFSDIAVLSRTNAGPALLAERLDEYNIPFRLQGSSKNLFDHWAAKDILAYLKAAESFAARGTAKRRDVLRILNRPDRRLNRELLSTEAVSFEKLRKNFRAGSRAAKSIDALERDLLMLAHLPPAAAVNYVRSVTGYDDYLRGYAARRGLDAEDLLEVADRVQESAKGSFSFREWEEKLRLTDEKQKKRKAGKQEDGDFVSLMTMHGAKGLEFPVVFIPDANETITPYRKAVSEADIEEERRLFYVAMTRAKDRLHVCYVTTRYGKPQARSRFIDEYGGGK